jgi:non-ribosomal peptide synthase protein (TIGR01720 family)
LSPPFYANAAGWPTRQDECKAISELLSWFDLSHLGESQQKQAIRTASVELQGRFDPRGGPAALAGFFYLGRRKPGRLLLVLPRLAVDPASWRILLEDILTAYQQISQRERITLLPRTATPQQWMLHVSELARSEAVKQEAAYWLDQSRMPVASASGSQRSGARSAPDRSWETLSTSLDLDMTRALLQEFLPRHSASVSDVLLAALVHSYALQTGTASVLLSLEGNGRETGADHMDFSRAVGRFSYRFPVRFEVDALKDPGGPGRTLERTRRRLAEVPRKGIGYGLLRHLSGDENTAETLRACPEPWVSFNYLGSADQLVPPASPFVVAGELSEVTAHDGHYPCAMNLRASLVAARLHLEWVFDIRAGERLTVEDLARRFVNTLQALLDDYRTGDGSSLRAEGNIVL